MTDEELVVIKNRVVAGDKLTQRIKTLNYMLGRVRISDGTTGIYVGNTAYEMPITDFLQAELETQRRAFEQL